MKEVEQEQERVESLRDRLGVGPSRASVVTLSALQAKHVYAGTVPPAVVARRRAANRAARRARRAGRAR